MRGIIPVQGDWWEGNAQQLLTKENKRTDGKVANEAWIAGYRDLRGG